MRNNNNKDYKNNFFPNFKHHISKPIWYNRVKKKMIFFFNVPKMPSTLTINKAAMEATNRPIYLKLNNWAIK